MRIGSSSAARAAREARAATAATVAEKAARLARAQAGAQAIAARGCGCIKSLNIPRSRTTGGSTRSSHAPTSQCTTVCSICTSTKSPRMSCFASRRHDPSRTRARAAAARGAAARAAAARARVVAVMATAVEGRARAGAATAKATTPIALAATAAERRWAQTGELGPSSFGLTRY